MRLEPCVPARYASGMPTRRKPRARRRGVARCRARRYPFYPKYVEAIWEEMQEALDDPKVEAAGIAYFAALKKKLAELSRRDKGPGVEA